MRIPVSNNRLVAFTLVGALLTVAVAGALAFPLDDSQSNGSDAPSTVADGGQHVTSDAPPANQNFTPAVQGQSSGGEEREHEGYEHEDDEHDD